MSITRALSAMLRDEEGISLAEYGIIAAFLAVPLIAAGYALAYAGGNTLTNTGTQLTAIGANPP